MKNYLNHLNSDIYEYIYSIVYKKNYDCVLIDLLENFGYEDIDYENVTFFKIYYWYHKKKRIIYSYKNQKLIASSCCLNNPYKHYHISIFHKFEKVEILTRCTSTPYLLWNHICDRFCNQKYD